VYKPQAGAIAMLAICVALMPSATNPLMADGNVNNALDKQLYQEYRPSNSAL